MTFNEYQQQALSTVHRSLVDDLLQKTIYVMGISGESGEVIEKWKKIVAYQDGKIGKEDVTEISKELGDILWYIAVFADSLGLNLDDIVNQNINKLQDRLKRKVITGQGDNR